MATCVGLLVFGISTQLTAQQPASATRTDSLVRIYINLPAYRMDVSSGDSSWSAPIAIGTRKYQTPRGNFRIRTITWNPWWIPPDSDWARDEKPTPPGPANPVGKVKLQVTGLVYIHGSPYVQSFGTAASHACIRVADSTAVRVALQLHRQVLAAPVRVSLDSLLADYSITRVFDVGATVPVTLDYRLAEVRADSLLLYPNVYALRSSNAHRDAMLAIESAGVDTLRIDRVRLRSLLKVSRTRRVAAALSTVLRGVQ